MASASLNCVLRVGGDKFDVDAALANLALQPYRIDKASIGPANGSALHYDVSSDEAFTSEALSTAIERFILENKKDLIVLRQMNSLKYFELDVALLIDEKMPMRTLTMSETALKSMAEVGLALTVSAYKTSDA